MTLRGNVLLVALLAGSLIGVVACGDDDGTSSTTSTSSTSSSTTGSGGMGSGGMGSGGMGTGGTPGPDCMAVCTDLFQCGLEDNQGMQLCVGFSGGGGAPGITEADFVPGCIPTCESTPALANLVNPANCPGTISTIKGVSPDFATACDGM